MYNLLSLYKTVMLVNQVTKSCKYFDIVLDVKADVMLHRKCVCNVAFGEKRSVGCRVTLSTQYEVEYRSITINKSYMYNRN